MNEVLPEKPRVLIGCPTYHRYKYCIDEYFEAIKALDYTNYDLLLVDNSPDETFYRYLISKGIPADRIDYCEPARERIVRSRNLLRQRAIDEGYDYFLSLEQDVIACPDLINRLLSHRKDIVTAYYGNDLKVKAVNKKTHEIKEVTINLPLVYVEGDDGKTRRAKSWEVKDKGLMEIKAMGLGCALISTEVLKKIKFRYDPERKGFDDIHFCIDAREEGYKLFLDTELRVKHLHKDWQGIEK